MFERLLEAERKTADLERRVQRLLEEAQRSGQDSRALFYAGAWPTVNTRVNGPGILVTTPPIPTVGYLEITVLGCQSVPAAGLTVTHVATGDAQVTDAMGKVTFSGTSGASAIYTLTAQSTFQAFTSPSVGFPSAGATITRTAQLKPLSGYLCTDCGDPVQLAGRTVATNLGHAAVYTAGQIDTFAQVTLGPVKAVFLGGSPPRLQLQCVAHNTYWQVYGTTSGCSPYAATFDFTGTHHDTSHGVTTVDIY